MKREPLSPENQRILDEYIREGLIGEEFIPQGETHRERYYSIESRAYLAWIRKNMNACGNRSPEGVRTMFQMRHDPYWTPPPLEIPTGLVFPDVPGFTRPRDILPHGDAWLPEEEMP